MGVDWYPFRLRPEASKTDFEKMIDQQRRYFLEWYRSGDTDLQQPAMEAQVIFGHSDELPEYVDALRIPPVDQNPVFPASWKHELFRTCFSEDAKCLVGKYLYWIELLREGRLPNFLKLRYIEYSEQELTRTWKWLQECVRAVRNRTNNWTRREVTLDMCRRIENVPKPHRSEKSIFDSYERFIETSPENNPSALEDIDESVAKTEKAVRDYIIICGDLNRAVKAEKCHCLAECFDAFLERMNDPFLDKFFGWAHKWINRGYGMFLSF